jgi:hypothetical protein
LKVAESPLVHVAGPSQTPAAVQTVLSGLLAVQTRSAPDAGDDPTITALAEVRRKRLIWDFMEARRVGFWTRQMKLAAMRGKPLPQNLGWFVRPVGFVYHLTLRFGDNIITGLVEPNGD